MQRSEQLEDEAEAHAIALLLRERAGESSIEAVPLEDIIAELGFGEDDLKRQ